MKDVMFNKLFVISMSFLLVFHFLSQDAIAQREASSLVVSDCKKCHINIVSQFFNQGGKHKESLDCLDCHMEHPPDGVDSIPYCGMCHEQDESSHYNVQNCLGCHNPHAPLEVDFTEAESVKEACSSCHSEQKEELEKYPSAHSEFDCKECHEAHGEFFNCLDCHEPHSNKIDEYKDCLLCHKPHMPAVVRYTKSLPVSYCSACHAKQAKDLQSTPFKHSTFKCTFCHRAQHKILPDCTTCHRFPHNAKLHKKYPDCKECHNTAHILVK